MDIHTYIKYIAQRERRVKNKFDKDISTCSGCGYWQHVANTCLFLHTVMKCHSTSPLGALAILRPAYKIETFLQFPQ